MKNLTILKERLKSIYQKKQIEQYNIPSLWFNPYDCELRDINVSPAEFFLSKIQEIEHLPTEDMPDSSIRIYAYNMFVRLATAYDHNGDGEISLSSTGAGWRETGTFLKAISLLPYIKTLGCNTIYLLPVNAIGKTGKKGNLGSPYAIADAYKIDENLCDPSLELEPEVCFSAFVEAAHLLGMKVIMEFVFRTASTDSPLALKHPEWFYWIREEIPNRMGYTNEKKVYGPPYFDEDKLTDILSRIENRQMKNLPQPDAAYKKLFTAIPDKVFQEDGRIVGITKDGVRCKIPSAFADWPPNDSQPVWSDVTYFRMYNNPKFNYIAYNTVRMYESSLAVKKNRVGSLWNHIRGIVPYYQKEFNIDGVMIDMGHALPDELLEYIIKDARNINPDFIFWEENFVLSADSAQKGFNASLGYLPFDAHDTQKVSNIIKFLASGTCPIDFFLTAETHNTKRAATRNSGKEFSKYIWTLLFFLPGIRFIHNGFELGESMPVNTGLGFESGEIEMFPPERLALFSAVAMNWNIGNEIINHIRYINEKIIQLGLKEAIDTGNYTISHVPSVNPKVISFIIKFGEEKFLIVGSGEESETMQSLLYLDCGATEYYDILEDKNYHVQNCELLLSLLPYQITIGRLK